METIEETIARIQQTMQTISFPTSEETNICPICKNTYWNVDDEGIARRCKCWNEELKRRKKSFANLPDGFKDMQLKTFTTSVYKEQKSKALIQAILKSVNAYLSEFTALQEQGKGLYLYSETKGSGKTRMAACIANELMKNHQVKFATSLSIIEEIKKTWEKEKRLENNRYDESSKMTEGKLIDELKTCEVLIIDDFGTEKYNEYFDNKFYHIVNERYNNKRVTIYTSNYDIDSLKYDERTANRIKETTFKLPFPEESVRDYIAEDNKKILLDYMKKGG